MWFVLDMCIIDHILAVLSEVVGSVVWSVISAVTTGYIGGSLSGFHNMKIVATFVPVGEVWTFETLNFVILFMVSCAKAADWMEYLSVLVVAFRGRSGYSRVQLLHYILPLQLCFSYTVIAVTSPAAKVCLWI